VYMMTWDGAQYIIMFIFASEVRYFESRRI